MRFCVIISIIALFDGLSPGSQHEARPEIAFFQLLLGASFFPPVMFTDMILKMHGGGFGVALTLIAVFPMVVLRLAMTGFFTEPCVYLLPLVQNLAFS